ncbi:PIN domain-containing protein [Microbacterium sp. M3]|uniref:PIN domain-containing protein n=1 Tax=Microbacterium arthrosphaerae TaxID=792652 RepID=A0ABU4GZM9_9MICO|nr:MULTISPECIES: PIN domain-containing protein [Microbacterium]MDW4571972.1 PIN domain-containing protein [Microbacterium arthrosphaerae]MDW7605827.1 PIN domain-containing protein [Microbacterium sp. M3]
MGVVFTATLDTSVLWPSLQRDFLLSLAVEGAYRPTWSSAILEELEYHEEAKLAKRGIPVAEAAGRAATLIAAMRREFADAEVEGWEPLEGTFGLPDQDDEHVVAAAVITGAGAIVTENLKDFPADRFRRRFKCSVRASLRRTPSHSTQGARSPRCRRSPAVPAATVQYSPSRRSSTPCGTGTA